MLIISSDYADVLPSGLPCQPEFSRLIFTVLSAVLSKSDSLSSYGCLCVSFPIL